MAIPFLAQAQPVPPAVSYVDNEFVALLFSSFSTSNVTTLERIVPDQVVVATRMDASSQVARDTGLTPGGARTRIARGFSFPRRAPAPPARRSASSLAR